MKKDKINRTASLNFLSKKLSLERIDTLRFTITYLDFFFPFYIAVSDGVVPFTPV